MIDDRSLALGDLREPWGAGVSHRRRRSLLRPTWERPDEFWAALVHHVNERHPVRLKSDPFVHYDFVFDALLRHTDRSGVSFVHLSQEPQTPLSYDDLADCVSWLATSWFELGVRPGATMAILRPIDESFIVSLLAGLWLGAVICPLEPAGTRRLAEGLEILQPDFVSSEESYSTACPGGSWTFLPSTTTIRRTDPPPPHAYRSGETAFRLFDALRPEPFRLVDVTADTAYLTALRDGALLFRIEAGKALAYPGMPSWQIHPPLLLATLLGGGTWVEADVASLTNPLELSVNVLGVTPALRDLVLDGTNDPTTAPPWDSWFCELGALDDTEGWSTFSERLSRASERQSGAAIPGSTIHLDRTLGGAVLWSDRGTDVVRRQLLPAPGVPWSLTDPLAADIPAVTGFGRLSIARLSLSLDDLVETICTVIDRGDLISFAGIPWPHRRGIPYPQEEVLAVVGEVVGSAECSIVAVPDPGTTSHEFHLLLFLPNRGPQERRDLHGVIRRRIETRLGAQAQPDIIRDYPLCVRRNASGDADHDWAAMAYLSGNLARMATDDRALATSAMRLFSRTIANTIAVGGDDFVE